MDGSSPSYAKAVMAAGGVPGAQTDLGRDAFGRALQEFAATAAACHSPADVQECMAAALELRQFDGVSGDVVMPLCVRESLLYLQGIVHDETAAGWLLAAWPTCARAHASALAHASGTVKESKEAAEKAMRRFVRMAGWDRGGGPQWAAALLVADACDPVLASRAREAHLHVRAAFGQYEGDGGSRGMPSRGEGGREEEMREEYLGAWEMLMALAREEKSTDSLIALSLDALELTSRYVYELPASAPECLAELGMDEAAHVVQEAMLRLLSWSVVATVDLSGALEGLALLFVARLEEMTLRWGYKPDMLLAVKEKVSWIQQLANAEGIDGEPVGERLRTLELAARQGRRKRRRALALSVAEDTHVTPLGLVAAVMESHLEEGQGFLTYQEVIGVMETATERQLQAVVAANRHDTEEILQKIQKERQNLASVILYHVAWSVKHRQYKQAGRQLAELVTSRYFCYSFGAWQTYVNYLLQRGLLKKARQVFCRASRMLAGTELRRWWAAFLAFERTKCENNVTMKELQDMVGGLEPFKEDLEAGVAAADLPAFPWPSASPLYEILHQQYGADDLLWDEDGTMEQEVEQKEEVVTSEVDLVAGANDALQDGALADAQHTKIAVVAGERESVGEKRRADGDEALPPSKVAAIGLPGSSQPLPLSSGVKQQHDSSFRLDSSLAAALVGAAAATDAVTPDREELTVDVSALEALQKKMLSEARQHKAAAAVPVTAEPPPRLVVPPVTDVQRELAENLLQLQLLKEEEIVQRTKKLHERQQKGLRVLRRTEELNARSGLVSAGSGLQRQQLLHEEEMGQLMIHATRELDGLLMQQRSVMHAAGVAGFGPADDPRLQADLLRAIAGGGMVGESAYSTPM